MIKNGCYCVAFRPVPVPEPQPPDGYTSAQTGITNVLLFIYLAVTGIDRGLSFLIRNRHPRHPQRPRFFTRKVFFSVWVTVAACLTGIKYHEKIKKKYRGTRCGVRVPVVGVPPPPQDVKPCRLCWWFLSCLWFPLRLQA